jgi:signal transduction histidine kinase
VAWPDTQSLEQKVERISAFAILSLGILLAAVLLILLYGNLESQHDRQVQAWLETLPKNVLPHLIESDYFPVNSKLQLMGKTRLFKSFEVADPRGNRIGSFGMNSHGPMNLDGAVPIKDEIGNVWGYYRFEVDHSSELAPFLWASGFALLLIVLLMFSVRLIVKRRMGREFVDHEYQAQKAKALNQLAAQVAHDIRSPLAALNMVLNNDAQMNKDHQSIALESAQRIHEIAADLLERYREDKTPARLRETFLTTILEPMIMEKKAQYRHLKDLEIRVDAAWPADFHYVRLAAKEFKRAFSNIVDNAVEAMDKKGEVTIGIIADDQTVTISIRDRGPGFEKTIVNKVGQEPGVTYGKTSSRSGMGLGLYQAKRAMDLCGGRLIVESKPDQGSQVSLQIPRLPAPLWLPLQIDTHGCSEIAVVDDQPTIHSLWKNRFEKARRGVKLHHFQCPQAFRDFMESLRVKGSVGPGLFLVDYEFPESLQTGIELIRDLGLQKQALLVTSRYEEPDVLRQVSAERIRMIPKSISAAIPIV